MAPRAGVFCDFDGSLAPIVPDPSKARAIRGASDKDAALQRAVPVVEDVAKEEGLASVTRGRLVLEISPPVHVNKGDVVRRVIDEKKLSGAFVVGDDLGDLPTFRAVDGLDLAIRVAVASDESPPDLIAAADHVVGSPQELIDLLKSLVDASRP